MKTAFILILAIPGIVLRLICGIPEIWVDVIAVLNERIDRRKSRFAGARTRNSVVTLHPGAETLQVGARGGN